MFSIFHQVLLRQPPRVDEPERLVNLGGTGPEARQHKPLHDGGYAKLRAGKFSYPMFRDLEARQTVLSEIAGHYATFANLSYRNQTQSSRALLVSGADFPALRVRPALGRMIGPQDEPQVGESAAAVLSYEYWQSCARRDLASSDKRSS